MLEEIKANLEELNNLLKLLEDNNLITKESAAKLKSVIDRFRFWIPSIYIYIEGGVLQYSFADCPMHFNLFDNDNEEAEAEDEKKLEVYNDKITEWKWMIESGSKDGTLKQLL